MKDQERNVYLGRNVVLHGDIVSPGTVIVDGNFKGRINAATVIVGKHAKITGEIHCQTGDFDGIIKGAVSVTDRMLVGVNGRIFAAVDAVKSRIVNRGIIIQVLKCANAGRFY